MKIKILTITIMKCLLASLILIGLGCKRTLSELQAPSYPTNGNVWINGFAGDEGYAAFGGSDVKAFQVDSQVTYLNSTASMRFAVPDTSSPQGSYAGGVFYSKTGRNLTGYNALSFYIKASQPITIGVVGFGNDLGASQYMVSLNNLNANSNWTQVIIPIPDPSKFTGQRGLFYYSAAPNNGRGYTFWIDRMQFVNLSTLANLTGSIQNGNNDSIPYGIAGDSATITNFQATVNLPTGVNETVSISPSYFSFFSSNSSVASVSATGGVNILTGGTSTITATLGSKAAIGSLKINSIGKLTPPPAPTKNPAYVLSLLTSVYHNVPVDYWNGYWQPYQITTSSVAKAGNDTIIQYSNLNFVGAQLTSPTQNISPYRSFHIDIFTPDNIASNSSLQIELLDFGANGVPGGGDDVSGTITIPSSYLASKKWISIDTVLSAFKGLTTEGHFGQIIFVGSNLPDVWIDNVYFWGYPITPTVAAPLPTQASSSVLSIYGNTYPNLPGTNFNPNWGQATVESQVTIAGNNTLLYSNLNYQGTQLAAPQNVSIYGFLHIDYYTSNSSSLNVNLINSAAVTGGSPVQTAYTLAVPTNGVWKSVDIPLSSFSPVKLAKVDQMSFAGNGTIYIGNIYFYGTSSGSGGSSGGSGGSGGTYNTNDVIDFEAAGFGQGFNWTSFEDGSNPALQFVANPNPSGINTSATVAKFTALQAGSTYAGCQTDYVSMGTFQLDATHNKVRIMVYKSVISNVGIKFATASNWAQVEVLVPNTKINQWEQLTFDFSAAIYSSNPTPYVQLIVFPDYNARTSDNVVYFDNITFGN